MMTRTRIGKKSNQDSWELQFGTADLSVDDMVGLVQEKNTLFLTLQADKIPTDTRTKVVKDHAAFYERFSDWKENHPESHQAFLDAFGTETPAVLQYSSMCAVARQYGMPTVPIHNIPLAAIGTSLQLTSDSLMARYWELSDRYSGEIPSDVLCTFLRDENTRIELSWKGITARAAYALQNDCDRLFEELLHQKEAKDPDLMDKARDSFPEGLPKLFRLTLERGIRTNKDLFQLTGIYHIQENDPLLALHCPSNTPRGRFDTFLREYPTPTKYQLRDFWKAENEIWANLTDVQRQDAELNLNYASLFTAYTQLTKQQPGCRVIDLTVSFQCDYPVLLHAALCYISALTEREGFPPKQTRKLSPIREKALTDHLPDAIRNPVYNYSLFLDYSVSSNSGWRTIRRIHHYLVPKDTPAEVVLEHIYPWVAQLAPSHTELVINTIQYHVGWKSLCRWQRFYLHGKKPLYAAQSELIDRADMADLLPAPTIIKH